MQLLSLRVPIITRRVVAIWSIFEFGLAALGEWNAEADIGIDPVERQLSTRKRPSISAPVDGWVGWEADIRTGLLLMLITSSPQLVQQRLRLFQIGRVEPLGEPAVDGGE